MNRELIDVRIASKLVEIETAVFVDPDRMNVVICCPNDRSESGYARCAVLFLVFLCDHPNEVFVVLEAIDHRLEEIAFGDRYVVSGIPDAGAIVIKKELDGDFGMI